MESIDLKNNLVLNPDRMLPDPYRCRLAQSLPPDKSQVYEQIRAVQEYAEETKMRINCDKSKFILFNPCTSYDFLPGFSEGEQEIACTEEFKLLGVHLRSDLKWTSNTDAIAKRAFAKLWTIRRLMKYGASLDDLKDVYYKQVRSIVEFAVPVWNSNITKKEIYNLERVQKAFLHIVLGD